MFLDYSSTTPLSSEVRAYVISLLDTWGNPSSAHSMGTQPRQIITEARQSVAEFINASPDTIYFTGGGAASNTLAVGGYHAKHNCTVLYSPIAHKSILECARHCKNSRPLKVDREGFINTEHLAELLDTCHDRPLAAIDYCNSEMGTIQKNISKITKLVHAHNGIVYLDCTGGISQIPLDVKTLDIDMAGLSAHKLGGLKGCGGFYKKPDIELVPLVYGSQEQGFVGGTENVLGIASLGKAVEACDYSSITSRSRDYVWNYIRSNIPDTYLVGPSIESGFRLPHNLYVCFKGIEGEALMILLDMNHIQVSTGSACNSRNLLSSAALSAIGMEPEDIHSCIRLTFCGRETEAELDEVCEKLKECADTLRMLSPGNTDTIDKASGRITAPGILRNGEIHE